MIDCSLILNADNLWHCPDCDWIYKPRRPTFLCRKPPKRNCPAKQTPEQIEAQARQQAEAKWLAKHGTGFHLHTLIKKYTGEGITAGCGCTSMIAQLNRNPPEWTRKNIDGFIDQMIEEVDRRLKSAQEAATSPPWRLRLGGLELPGRRYLLRKLILRAARLAERDLLKATP